jgi:hypothetical protein
MAAILIALLVLREAIEAWRGEEELPEGIDGTAVYLARGTRR